MKAKHTPGPWEVCVFDTSYQVRSADGINVAATSWHSHLRKPYPLKAEALANATLAAAAPDLLEALTDTLALLPPEYVESPVAEFARAAIAKATGNSGRTTPLFHEIVERRR